MDQVPASSRYGFLGFCLDTGARRLIDPQGEPVVLNDRAFDTLNCLVQHSGQTLSKDFLMKVVWPTEVVEENNLNQAILTLRKALGDNSRDPRFIHTVTRRGFCFTAPVEVLEPPSAQAPPTGRPAPRRFFNLPGFAALLLLAIGAWLLWPLRADYSAPPDLSDALEPAGETTELLPDSIAILPFKILNTADNSDFFSDGLHAEIISRLATLQGISVIGRESVMHLPQEDVDIASVRKLFKVETVMSGTILFHDDMARINLEIVDTDTLMNLWSGSYETATHTLDDIFSVHSDIAVNVAGALAATLDKQDLQQISQAPTSSYQAYAYFLASRQAFEKQDYRTAWQLGQQAVEQDPAYLDALYNFSHINAVLVGMPLLPTLDSKKHLELALDIADRYVSRAPERHEGYALRATALNIAGDQKAVMAEFERMTDMGFDIATMRFNPLLLSLGKFEQAIVALEKRVQLQPLNPYNRGFLMIAYEQSGRRQKARELYRLGNELHNRWWGDEVNIVLDMGRHEPLQDIDGLLVSEDLKHVLRNLHNQELVHTALLRKLRPDIPAHHEVVYYAAIAAHTGQPQLALDLMRKVLPSSWLNLVWVWLPVFDEMREEPGFATLLSDFGVTDYWDQLGWSEVCRRDNERLNCDWQAYTAL